MPERRQFAVIVTVAAALVVVMAAFLPWGRSGEADRSSFELVQAADRLGVLTGRTRHLAVAWYLLPALVALLWIAATLRRPVAVAALGLAAGGLAVAGAAVVLASPLKIGPGVPIAGAAGVAAVAGALLHAADRERRR
jgi:hypothetical protein